MYGAKTLARPMSPSQSSSWSQWWSSMSRMQRSICSVHDSVPSPSIRAARTSHFPRPIRMCIWPRSEEHTSELQSQSNLVCRLLLEKKKIDTHSLRMNDINSGVFASLLPLRARVNCAPCIPSFHIANTPRPFMQHPTLDLTKHQRDE